MKRRLLNVQRQYHMYSSLIVPQTALVCHATPRGVWQSGGEPSTSYQYAPAIQHPRDTTIPLRANLPPGHRPYTQLLLNNYYLQYWGLSVMLSQVTSWPTYTCNNRTDWLYYQSQYAMCSWPRLLASLSIVVVGGGCCKEACDSTTTTSRVTQATLPCCAFHSARQRCIASFWRLYYIGMPKAPAGYGHSHTK